MIPPMVTPEVVLGVTAEVLPEEVSGAISNLIVVCVRKHTTQQSAVHTLIANPKEVSYRIVVGVKIVLEQSMKVYANSGTNAVYVQVIT